MVGKLMIKAKVIDSNHLKCFSSAELIKKLPRLNPSTKNILGTNGFQLFPALSRASVKIELCTSPEKPLRSGKSRRPLNLRRKFSIHRIAKGTDSTSNGTRKVSICFIGSHLSNGFFATVWN